MLMIKINKIVETCIIYLSCGKFKDVSINSENTDNNEKKETMNTFFDFVKRFLKRVKNMEIK